MCQGQNVSFSFSNDKLGRNTEGRAGAIKEQRIVTNRFHHLCYLSVRVESIIIKRGIPIIASKEYIAASQHIFAVSHKEALCIKTNIAVRGRVEFPSQRLLLTRWRNFRLTS